MTRWSETDVRANVVLERGLRIPEVVRGGRTSPNEEDSPVLMRKTTRLFTAAVEMMRKLGTKKTAAKTHFYPLAMATYDIMPPPAAKEKAVGEERIVNYTGAGLSLGAEIDVDPATAEWAKGLPEDADLTRALANHVWEKVNEEYKAIEACNVPGGGDVPLPSNAVRPVRPPSVPVF